MTIDPIDPKVLNIRQDTSAEKFYLHMEGKAEAYLKYKLHTEGSPNIVEFTEMHVPKVLEGINVEREMALEAMRFVDNAEYKVKSSCAYMDGYLNQNPQFQHLIAR